MEITETAYLVDVAGSGFVSEEAAAAGTRSLLELPLFKTVRSLFTYLPMLWRRSWRASGRVSSDGELMVAAPSAGRRDQREDGYGIAVGV